MRRAIAVGLALLSLILAVGCTTGPAPAKPSPRGLGQDDPAQAFDSPPAWPGYQWSFLGSPVGWQVIASTAGPAHCGWQTVTFMTIAWPPGSYADTAVNARLFIRDPKNVMPPGAYLASPLDLHAKLPADARPIGLTYGGLSLYTSPTDVDVAIYVVGKHVTERWPRSNPMELCA